MYRLQNVSVATNADSDFKELPCGYHSPAGIIYDRLGAADGRGRNFLVQPTPLGYLVKSVVLQSSTTFNINEPLAWGIFSEAMDSLAVHPMGYVVGVNRQSHRMEILQLPAAPVDAARAPNAVPFAVLKAGEGTRPGLLRVPVAVTVFDGAIFVLESGNARVQAFDVSGNPVRRFKNGTSSTFDLADGTSITLLDIDVDGLGYVFVLSHTSSGAMVSDYRLDIYTPAGNLLTRTTGLAAARMAVDTFRNVYALNYETLAGAPRIEPSLSHWAPSTPMT
jgi:hypothetical protein